MPDFAQSILTAVAAYIPLSLIGAWRWSVWGSKKLGGLFYRPLRRTWPDDRPKPKVSLIVPVYNEDSDVFELALQSWVSNGVDEIIAVIDYSNVRHIVEFTRRYVPRQDVRCRLVVTRKPGKRPALADGALQATGDIIVLVDSDAIWNDRVISSVLPYFLDPSIGGVATQQRVYEPKTLAQMLFDILLWVRYNEELPFLLGAGKVVNTLSGRTAFYRREALLHDVHDNLHHLTHEFYFKSRCISGDDKRLTHLVLEQGWHLGFAQSAVIYTPGAQDMKTFLKQRLRWTRNSWRADTRAFQRGWIFRHPALAFHNFDRFIQPFFMLVGPMVFGLALWQKEWLIAVLIVVWWFLSRLIRLWGYFMDHPSRVVYLPAYILFSYYTAIVKIFAWATLFEQGWITRWDKKRLARVRHMATLRGAALTASSLVLLFLGIVLLHEQTREHPLAQAIRQPEANTRISASYIVPAVPEQGPAYPEQGRSASQLQAYTVRRGDTLHHISRQLGVTIDDLRHMNNLPDRNTLTIGQILYYITP